jgi:hypothetical protein
MIDLINIRKEYDDNFENLKAFVNTPQHQKFVEIERILYKIEKKIMHCLFRERYRHVRKDRET